MQLIYFSRAEWESWGLERQPLIPEGMPVLIDDDLRFEDNGVARPTVAVNAWLRELPTSGAPSPRSWKAYARALRAWLEFLTDRSVHAFADREDLRAVLGAFSEYRLSGPVEARWEGSTWNDSVRAVARFYAWAVDEGHCVRVPFTYAMGTRYTEAGPVQTRRNTATVRQAKAHVTLKYLEPDFAQLFLRALAGLTPDGEPDKRYRGREVGRNAAVGGLVFASGPRSQEFTHLLTYEIPRLPVQRTPIPVRFPLPGAITKGRKFRETWITHGPLAAVHNYVELERALAAERGPYRPDPSLGEPLFIEAPDWEGARLNGRRVSWRQLSPAERRRLIAPDGSSPLLSLQSTGKPFVDWGTAFRRTSERIREHYEPRFPTVTPHTGRHTFAMATLEMLVKGYYQQAANLITVTDGDAALINLLRTQDPLMILRDLLGHSSVVTTEIYVRRLDVHRLYRETYERVGQQHGLYAVAEAEAAAEFNDEDWI